MLQTWTHIRHPLNTRRSRRAIQTLWLHRIVHKKALLWFTMSLKKPGLRGLGRAGQGGSPEHNCSTAFTPWACPVMPLQGSLSHTAGLVQADRIPLYMCLRYLQPCLFWTSLIFLFISPENFYLQRLFSKLNIQGTRHRHLKENSSYWC